MSVIYFAAIRNCYASIEIEWISNWNEFAETTWKWEKVFLSVIGGIPLYILFRRNCFDDNLNFVYSLFSVRVDFKMILEATDLESFVLSKFFGMEWPNLSSGIGKNTEHIWIHDLKSEDSILIRQANLPKFGRKTNLSTRFWLIFQPISGDVFWFQFTEYDSRMDSTLPLETHFGFEFRLRYSVYGIKQFFFIINIKPS